ncbi:alpha/beta fold hydrolase [Saccharothrix violaceirubra]|uniref:Pimeloyl-ACP methyl ester carboxylesterase n=1 Tax=Saccharothrix violaceirubra TaxID=413306 RepID=A0A7W7SZC6_9PSEU|nr:alpha/beta hydrolase [Saccharothrix violaceirubra]MBB4963713.1 pimeloyl-ACP methyl ester carboxylesterase [Saccharothrix violaceirubra]
MLDRMREHDVVATDGTRIRAWDTGVGPDVLLCTGLGALPGAWPAAGARVRGWHYRGTFGSARPDDPDRIAVDDHVADAVAVLDDAGVGRCVVAGWAMGVTVAAALALRHPERVSGLLLVAGAPGDAFAGAFGVPGVPESVRRALGVLSVSALRLAAPVLDGVLHRVPLAGSLGAVLRHDWAWYFTLSLALGRTPRFDLRPLTCPTTVLAGRYDPLAAASDVVGAAGSLPQARVRVVPNTHLLPVENPGLVVAELDALVRRAAAVREALLLTPRSPGAA